MTPKTFLGRKQGSDLKQWLDSISEPPPQPLSPYHEAPEDFLPQKHETRPGVAAPDFKPDPYVWQDDQRTEYPEMNRIATVEPPAIAKPGQSRWDTGDCLAYANALTEEYPWLSLASAGVKEEQEEGWTPYHYFAVDPNGNAYDVTGKRTVEQLLKDNQFNYWEVTHRDYEGESDGMPDDPEVARHVIKDNQTKLLSARMSGIGFLPEQFKHGNTRRDAAIWENRVPFLLDPQGNLMVGKVGDWHADLNPDEIRQTFGLTPDQDPWGATSAYQGMAMVNLPDMEDIWQWPHAFQEVNPEAMPDAATVERVQQLVKASYDAYTQHQAKKELSEHEKAKKHWYDEAWSKNPIPEEGTEDPVKGDEDFLDRP